MVDDSFRVDLRQLLRLGLKCILVQEDAYPCLAAAEPFSSKLGPKNKTMASVTGKRQES